MNSSNYFMGVCQLCKTLSNRGNICKKCFLKQRRLKQIEYWNNWIKEKRKYKNPKKIRFADKEDAQIVRNYEQEVNLKISREVMDTLQDMIYVIVETKQKSKKRIKRAIF